MDKGGVRQTIREGSVSKMCERTRRRLVDREVCWRMKALNPAWRKFALSDGFPCMHGGCPGQVYETMPAQSQRMLEKTLWISRVLIRYIGTGLDNSEKRITLHDLNGYFCVHKRTDVRTKFIYICFLLINLKMTLLYFYCFTPLWPSRFINKVSVELVQLVWS